MSFDRSIGLGDTYGTRAEVAVLDDADEEGPATIHVSLLAGMSGGRGIATPEAARQLAAALLDAAEDAEGGDHT
jgi:hypothetical protein